MQSAPIGLLAARKSFSRRLTSASTVQSVPSLANVLRFFAAPNPPGIMIPSSSAAVTDFTSRIFPRAIRAASARTFRFSAAGLPLRVVHDIRLVLVGCHAHDFGSVLVQKIQRESGFVYLAAVHHSTAGKKNSDFRGHSLHLFMSCPPHEREAGRDLEPSPAFGVSAAIRLSRDFRGRTSAAWGNRHGHLVSIDRTLTSGSGASGGSLITTDDPFWLNSSGLRPARRVTLPTFIPAAGMVRLAPGHWKTCR